ncbi:GNAT family N-acetyltransferase [Lentibacillus saliphilus]|uniref:GNAT family N-acetyltransferase n=1 Tax=Lentibacillus saliphilus TaxID=2737028 RepID=UPI001C301320|nr:GNAT family N-acetyltransferase [Lentibacillus saliphilus]
MITYRTYQTGDEKRIVQLWNASLPKDPIMPNRFRNVVLLDGNFDPKGMCLAFDGERLVGCVFAIRRLTPMTGNDLEPENGWMTFFFVDQQYKRCGIGRELLQNATAFLHSHGIKHVFFASYAPNYILPGIDEETYSEGYQFLLAHQFEKLYSPVAMDYNLVSYVRPESILHLKEKRMLEGYTFTQCHDKDLYEVIQFANLTFNPDWGRAIREGILQGLPLHRILVVRKNEKIVGFCMYGGYEGVPDRFGPFGVDPDQQGKGLGKIILHECLYQMKAEGLHGAWFLWTGEASSAGYLYKKTGFKTTRRFHVMRKDI